MGEINEYETVVGKRRLERLGMYGRIMLRWILEK
jgi:hypothetical protein